MHRVPHGPAWTQKGTSTPAKPLKRPSSDSGRFQVALLHKHTALVSSSTKPGVTINMKDLKNMSTPIINNGLARSRLSVKSKSNTLVSMDSKKNKKNNLYGHVTGGDESDSENSSVYHEPYKLLPNSKQEYGCLLKTDPIKSSKSGEYAGEFIFHILLNLRTGEDALYHEY